MNEITTSTILEKMKELIDNVLDGTIISISLENEKIDDVLRSITVIKESKTYEIKMDDFFDKKVFLFYIKTAKLLPNIVGGQICDIDFDHSTIYRICIQKGDSEIYHLFIRSLIYELGEQILIVPPPTKISEFCNEFLLGSGNDPEIPIVEILVQTLTKQE